MRTLQFVLLQMDEATGLIRDGRIPHLRIALILLDNAVEVLLHQWAKEQLVWDSRTRRTYENAKRWGAPEDLLRKFNLDELLTPPEERRVLRVFDELIKYATDVKHVIQPEIADALSHLHRYRNEAHHRAKVRKATIRTAVVLLFDIAARLFLSDVGRVRVYSSDEDYSWLSQRFGIPPRELFTGDTLGKVAMEQLRGSLPQDATNIARAMAAHLEARIEDLLDSLDFLSKTARIRMTREQALRDACEYVQSRNRDADLLDRMPPGFDGKLSLATVEHVNQTCNEILEARDALAAFSRFAAAETELEHLEFATLELASEVEAMIQLEIDIARGR